MLNELINNQPIQLTQPDSTKLTDWVNEPTVADLKEDYTNCKSSHDKQEQLIDDYLVNYKAEPLKFEGRKAKTRSTVQSKLIRKQAEWRYSALSEPFLATPNIFKVNPVTYEDNYSAKQNELVLNHQFNTQINKVKFIDEYIRRVYAGASSGNGPLARTPSPEDGALPPVRGVVPAAGRARVRAAWPDCLKS